ncbi:MAG TPA: C1 family peptidase [Ktedonobacterales bacterium]|nr:C1 family peptidase [Ktedonobacterales bacterium]
MSQATPQAAATLAAPASPHHIKRYGWIPDLPDQRDQLYAAPAPTLATLPASADLRPQCPPVYDQGELGSCTANAIAAAIEFDQMRQKLPKTFIPSRLFIYYNERVIEGTVGTDSGAQIRDGIKSVAHQGACPEAEWKYDITKFAKQPDQQCYRDAALDRVVTYQRLVPSLTQMKGCLASGFPFVFGFTVYASFKSPDVAKTGQVPMPALGEPVLGGHAVMAVGYDDTQQRFIARNSWGATWGMAGYFTMPYAYLLQAGLASDFWTVRLVTEGPAAAAQTPVQ